MKTYLTLSSTLGGLMIIVINAESEEEAKLLYEGAYKSREDYSLWYIKEIPSNVEGVVFHHEIEDSD